MDLMILIITLVVGALGVLLFWFGYKKDELGNSATSKRLGKKLLILAIVALFGKEIAIPFLDHFKPNPPPAATPEDVEQIVTRYMGDKPKNPPIEEVKSEAEEEAKAASDKAIELYELGNNAYNKNQFNDATIHFKAALEILKIPSFYLSLGNSFLVGVPATFVQ